MMKPVSIKQKTVLIDNHLAKLCGDINVPSKVFLGRITLGLMDKESRDIMIQMKIHEYDNLRRADCMAFGKEIIAKLLKKSP